jgi:hypothetical protein
MEDIYDIPMSPFIMAGIHDTTGNTIITSNFHRQFIKTHPEYMRYIDAVEKTLPYVQKMDKFHDTMGEFHDKHLKPRDADAEEEYKKYSYTNHGGKYKTKTNKRKQKNKRNQKNKTKRR